MTWPVTSVSTANLDAGTDEPRLARVELKQAVDNINAIAAEFGNVATASATNDQILVRSGGVWQGSNTINNLDLLDFDTAAGLTPTAGQMTWDAAQGTLQLAVTNNVITRIGQDLAANVTNADSVTINKGQPVYHFGAQGDRASVKLALNTSDATSAKTFGIAAENIAAGQTGMIITQGILEGIDTSAYTAGDTLYLGATAGSVTNVKPRAPNHMVYLGTVSKANAGNGIIFVKIQNGYELDEIHDANITTPATDQVLQYSGNVWVNQYPQMTRYTEPTGNIGNVTGTVNVNWQSGNQQRLTMTGNVTLGFYNAPTSGTITVIVNTNSTNRAITFANTARFAGNVRTISTTNTTDIIVATTYDSGANYLISIIKGFD